MSIKTKERALWYSMLERCYSIKSLNWHPSYHDCHVSDNFKDFQFFSEWCNKQIGFNQKGFQLDKDILGDGKLYSEDTCCFVPKEINLAFKGAPQRSTGMDLPVGVYFHKNRNKSYQAKIQINGKSKSLGYYISPEEAYDVYKDSKNTRLVYLANKYKDSLDILVYNKLLNYKLPLFNSESLCKTI